MDWKHCWRRSGLGALVVTACLVFPTAARADIVVESVGCTFGTFPGAPAGGFYDFTITDLPAGDWYYVAVTATGDLYAGSWVFSRGAQRYTGEFYGPLTVLILPPSAVTASGVIVTGYDRNATPLFRTVIVVPPCAEQRLTILTGLVAALNVNVGIQNSLDTKLANVLDALAAAKNNSAAIACNKLNAFVNEVQAQSGTHIHEADAATLIHFATDIQTRLGCG